jgi:3-dehydroquinate dehydratase
VLVLAPAAIAVELAGAVPYSSLEDVTAALTSTDGPAVLVSDGLLEEQLAALAAEIRRLRRQVIEVRAERWDGASFSPLSAACRGVISGFGLDGIGAALHLLRMAQA